MLDVLASSLFALLWEILGKSPQKVEALSLIPWHEAAIFELPSSQFEPQVQKIVDLYLENLSQQGINSDRQGVWLQSDWSELATHQGNVPVSAASLTKIATTLAALGTLGVNHQFMTNIYHTGQIQDGVLQGDLIIEGGRDPFFVWEEAIALSNTLNQLGIQQITGNLLVNKQFYMNYQSEPLVSGELLKQGLDSSLWSSEIKQQFLALSLTTPRPQLSIQGKVQVVKNIPSEGKLLLQHQSLPLIDILKQMNIYSNNAIAQMLADIVGGASVVARYGIQATGVSSSEIQLINGSGLGIENRISPRAVTKMLMVINNLLQPHSLEVMDLFPVAGRDSLGTMANRQLPDGVAIKTGTLNQVSALAGVVSLDPQRQVWFAIINSGSQIEQFRQQQDKLLQQLASHWQLPSQNFNKLVPKTQVYLGDPKRNKLKN